jgi:hypothetical protein
VWWNGTAWNRETLPGGAGLAGDPAVTVDALNYVQSITRGTDGTQQHIWWNGTTWNRETLPS